MSKRVVGFILIGLAAVLFYAGLFVGLQVSSNGGSALWVAALLIGASGLVLVNRVGNGS